MKIITVCGSLKFKDEIMKITEKMTLRGNCMLSIVYPTDSNHTGYTREEKELLGRMHKERIRISDAILVVDINHYIGSSTQGDIDFARALGKEIIYYTNIKELMCYQTV